MNGLKKFFAIDSVYCKAAILCMSFIYANDTSRVWPVTLIWIAFIFTTLALYNILHEMLEHMNKNRVNCFEKPICILRVWRVRRSLIAPTYDHHHPW